MDMWRLDRLDALERRIERLYLAMFHHRAIVLFASAFFCLLSLSGLPKLHVNNSMDVWFSDKTPSYRRYKEFAETFGHDEYLFIALDFGNVFTDSNLAALTRLSDAFGNIRGVVDVVGLPSATDVRSSSASAASGGGEEIFVEEIRNRIGVEPAESIRRRVLSDERYVRQLVSPDGHVAVLLLRFSDPKTGCGLVEPIERTLKAAKIPYHLGGYIFAQREMDRMTFWDYFVFGSICLVILTALFQILFKSVRITLIFLADCGLTVGVVLGWMGHAGVPIHLMTGILPPLLMAMAIADDIHMVERFLRGVTGPGLPAPGADRSRWINKWAARSCAGVAVPSLLSALTTFVGFFSLSGGAVPAIWHFGFWSGVGIAFTYVFSFLVIPVLLTFVSPPSSIKTSAPAGAEFEKWLIAICDRHRRMILWAFAGLCVVSVFGVKRIVIDTQLTNFFVSKSEFMRSMDFIEQKFGNTGPVEIILTSSEPDGLKRPETLMQIDRLIERLKTLPHVKTVLSINPVLKTMTRALTDGRPEDYRLPDRRDLLEQELLALSLSPSGDDTLNRYVNPSWTSLRIQIRLPRMSNNEAIALFDQIEKETRSTFGPAQAFYLTGVVEAYARLDRFILKSQLQSLGLTLIAVTLVFWLQVGRPLWAILALIPNVFPIVLMLATMGWTGITLNVATATVASITLGLADDDTVFFFYAYLRRRKSGQPASVAVPETVLECGRPLWLATILNVVGFSIFVFSSFRPTVYFGVLTSEVWILAIVCEFILLPALLLTLDRPDDRR